MLGIRTAKRHRRIADVHLLLIREERILLTLRQGTGFADGHWQVPSGHLEGGEHTAAGAAREASEEIGVVIDPDQLELVHFIDHRQPGKQPRLGFFYRAHTWQGDPYNAEPHKCGSLAWYPLTGIPHQTVPYQAVALDHIRAGRLRSTFGWDDSGTSGKR